LIGRFVIGLIGLLIVLLIPYFGMLIYFLAGLVGVGAFVIGLQSSTPSKAGAVPPTPVVPSPPAAGHGV
ncbi:MAG: hypothetical protein ACE5GA_07235, partial [Candidatus Zixiibacteriota bacterium]